MLYYMYVYVHIYNKNTKIQKYKNKNMNFERGRKSTIIKSCYDTYYKSWKYVFFKFFEYLLLDYIKMIRNFVLWT